MIFRGLNNIAPIPNTGGEGGEKAIAVIGDDADALISMTIMAMIMVNADIIVSRMERILIVVMVTFTNPFNIQCSSTYYAYNIMLINTIATDRNMNM